MKISKIKDLIKNHKILSIIIITLILIVLITAFDMRLKVSHFSIESDKIDSPVRFAVITDLHSCYYGENQKTLISAIEKASPDAILLVGDILDDTKSDKNAGIFINNISDKCQCYYVSGNHEARIGKLDDFKTFLIQNNVTVLTNEVSRIIIKGQTIQIAGIDDPSSGGYAVDIRFKETTDKTNFEDFSVLLSHRPELIDEYNKYAFDLVVSGHAHGGQWCLPFVDLSLVAPGQGIFPKYTSGLCELQSGKLIVSKGLARESTLIPRIYNRPEIMIITVT
ncbi:MAG: metallophosphoesterase [Ruminococcus sp.]|jgi:predicted MPP superfamily phosphohydrolase|nr:metallophosphoesterase [Ruminococcus sp.]